MEEDGVIECMDYMVAFTAWMYAAALRQPDLRRHQKSRFPAMHVTVPLDIGKRFGSKNIVGTVPIVS